MHRAAANGDFDDMMSGTTAISVMFDGPTICVGNVGDSRAIVASIIDHSQPYSYAVEPLSIDQTPFRRDERDRVKRCGARVLTMDQIEGLRDPNDQDFGEEEDDDGDPPRVWCREGRYPGTAFTRSLGDQIAEQVGVFAEPEIMQRHLEPNDAFILVARHVCGLHAVA